MSYLFFCGKNCNFILSQIKLHCNLWDLSPPPIKKLQVFLICVLFSYLFLSIYRPFFSVFPLFSSVYCIFFVCLKLSISRVPKLSCCIPLCPSGPRGKVDSPRNFFVTSFQSVNSGVAVVQEIFGQGGFTAVFPEVAAMGSKIATPRGSSSAYESLFARISPSKFSSRSSFVSSCCISDSSLETIQCSRRAPIHHVALRFL